VSLTFDLDAEAGLTGQGAEWRDRLSALSDQRYGAGRGLARVLRSLDEHDLRATFYVPGATALRHPQAMAAILEQGHEVGHHGHEHLAGHRLTADAQREEIVLGTEALAGVTGARPRRSRRLPTRGSRSTAASWRTIVPMPCGSAVVGCSSCPSTGCSTTLRTSSGHRVGPSA
jgi:peptidoglycan/xylan/chitin deacetylase (PgdA/CDA1 family)